MATVTYPYSTFLREPSRVLPDLDGGVDIILERRGDPPLVISRWDRYQALQFAMGLTARLLRRAIKDDQDRTVEMLSEEMPWLSWLPEGDQIECIHELLTNLAAGAEVANLEPFSRAVNEWRHTAEVWADPELAERLSSPLRGDGPELARPGP